MTITYDQTVNAVYVRLASGAVADTVEIEPMIVVDIDVAGRPLGIEFVYAEDFLPFIARHGDRLDLDALLPLTAARRIA